jgi:hypothetical protein
VDIDTAKAWYGKHRRGQNQTVSHYYHQLWFNTGQLGTGCGGFKADWLADF